MRKKTDGVSSIHRSHSNYHRYLGESLIIIFLTHLRVPYNTLGVARVFERVIDVALRPGAAVSCGPSLLLTLRLHECYVYPTTLNALDR